MPRAATAEGGAAGAQGAAPSEQEQSGGGQQALATGDGGAEGLPLTPLWPHRLSQRGTIKRKAMPKVGRRIRDDYELREVARLQEERKDDVDYDFDTVRFRLILPREAPRAAIGV